MSHTSMVGQWVDVRREEAGLPRIRGEVVTVTTDGALHVQAAFMWDEESKEWYDISPEARSAYPVIVTHPGWAQIFIIYPSEENSVKTLTTPDPDIHLPNIFSEKKNAKED